MANAAPAPALAPAVVEIKAQQRHPPNSPQPQRNEPGEIQEPGDEDAPAQPKKPPGFLSRINKKLNLDILTVVTMFKGSLPPTIGIAISQAPAVSAYFTTMGYLVPIVSVLALPVLPRGKFLMNFFLSLLAVCLGAAMTLLALWSAVQARLNTSPPPTPGGSGTGALPRYNSSQAVVCAIWLFFNTWLGNVIRAKLPAFNVPVIIYSIFINVATTFGPWITTVAAVQIFVKELLTAMLVGLTLSLGVNLVVFPISSRLVVAKEFAGVIGLLRATVSLQKTYLISIESEDMFAVATRTDSSPINPEDGPGGDRKWTREARAAAKLQESGAKLRELAGKLHADLRFAKRDIAWGKLSAKDLGEMFTLSRNVYIPVLGMATIADIFRRVSEHRGWSIDDDAPEDLVAEKEREKRVWNGVMRQMHEPFAILSAAIDKGLEHTGICLELLPKPRQRPDVEARQEEMPGDANFAKDLAEKLQVFRSTKGELLRRWVKENANVSTPSLEEEPSPAKVAAKKERQQIQLYILLYMESLMDASGAAVQELVRFADKKIQDGTMSRKRLITPTFRHLRKWLVALFSNEDSSAEQAPDLMESCANIVTVGDGYNQRKDPEHLPPASMWERFGNQLRKIPRFLESQESAFGFRVACATMTIGIVAFLESTYVFFMEQRLVWAMIMIAIGMTMTSGQSFFGFLCRVGGTIFAMCAALVIWYIVNGRIPGAIVFLWLSVFLSYYFFLKFPRFTPAVLIAIVTQVLIIGYEIQVLTIGIQVAERTGQPYYPTYLLAPYRLACVAGGTLVAFFWTIFPSSLTDRTWLRRDLSATLYLVANYFGVISSTIQTSLDGTGGDANVPGTPAHQLYKTGRKIFGKVMMLIPSMTQHSEWQKWEVTIGGQFPRAAYDDIIHRSTRIMAYLTLLSYALMHPACFQTEPATSIGDQSLDDRAQDETPTEAGAISAPNTKHHSRSRSSSVSSDSRAWLDTMRRALATLEPTHYAIISTLTLLSNALLSGQSLPPFLPLPQPYELTRRLMQISSSKSAATRQALPFVDDGRLPEPPPYHSDEKGESTRSSQEAEEANRSTLASLLNPRNMEREGYAEFAVLQVCVTLVCDDIEALIRAVSGLVGVVDFSVHVAGSPIPTHQPLSSDSEMSMGKGDAAMEGLMPVASRRGAVDQGGKGKGKLD